MLNIHNFDVVLHIELKRILHGMSMCLQMDNETKDICPICGSEEIYDHSEFGLPGFNNFRCVNWHLWNKEELDE